MTGEGGKNINEVGDNAQKMKNNFACYNENINFACNMYVCEL